jgi:hypothetical protein
MPERLNYNESRTLPRHIDEEEKKQEQKQILLYFIKITVPWNY